MTARLLACVLLLGVAGAASAQNQPATTGQQPAAHQLTPQQREAIRKQNQVLVKYAESIVAMIDNGQTGQVWDQASDVAKHAVQRDQFVKTVQDERARLGKMTARQFANINRQVSRGGKLPNGTYVNVNFATRFASHAGPMLEKVSFHHDSDDKWRLSGYTLLQRSAAPREATPGKQRHP